MMRNTPACFAEAFTRRRAAACAALVALTLPLLAQSAQPRPAAPVDLSGSWGYAVGNSFSPTGTAQDAGTPADGVPYQPWAVALMKSRKTMSGPNATFNTRNSATLETTDTTDPLEQCTPNGIPRILTWPAKFKFLQAPDVVYILYEYGPYWRPVWMNRQHPPADELDSTFFGHAIGRYEGNDTFIVDTVGFNDKTWLDDVGRPHTDKLHLIERYRRVDQGRLEVTLTIDDPGAYTSTFTFGPRTVLARTTDFGAALWTCTIENNKEFFKDIAAPTLTAPAK
jgi:hypothetical protein